MRFNISKHSEGHNNSEDRKFDREHFEEIENNLGHHFNDITFLQRALTHRSAPHGTNNDYERLEFLGDAILDLVVADLLLVAHQDVREGELSKMRAALVNTSSLANIARRIHLGKYIKLSRGESANGGADRSSILADVFEATMGAIYRDSDFNTVFTCAKNLFGDEIYNVKPTDPKTELQEALHAAGSEAPIYLLECVEGPEHAPTFISVVEVDKQIVGRGSGPTKKASQQAAAAEALERLLKEDEIDQEFLTIDPEALAEHQAEVTE